MPVFFLTFLKSTKGLGKDPFRFKRFEAVSIFLVLSCYHFKRPKKPRIGLYLKDFYIVAFLTSSSSLLVLV